ncbi:MAG: PIN domain-containing protein [Caulobacter sp.]|nr:PIN domain-containing protein [Caulobacter sp.]
MFHLDTNVIVWLSGHQAHRLSRAGLAAIKAGPVRISPMVMLELQYLRDIGRLPAEPDAIFRHLEGRIGLALTDTPFAAVVAQARRIDWTRDPFDRLIVGAALAEGVPLVSADRHILQHLPSAIW